MSCASSGTYLQWGNLVIQNGTLKRFEEVTRYDNSGTDAIGASFTIEVEGYVTEAESSHSVIASVGASTSSAPLNLAVIKNSVWLPRQELQLRIGGFVVLRATPSPPRTPGQSQQVPGADYVDFNPAGRFVVDIDNGPRCVSFSVNQVFGNRAMQVSITLQCTVALCAGPYHLINNRWSMTEDFDSDWLLRRTMHGIARVAHVDAWTNAIKFMVLPPLLNGFRVESMNFGRSANGLELTYQIVMQQKHAAPPYPASDWKCTAAEETGIGGAYGRFSFNISLTGFVGVRKQDLFVVAIKTLLTRLGKYSEADNRTTLIRKLVVVDHLDSNRLDMAAEADRLWGESAGGNDPGQLIVNGTNRWLGVVWNLLGVLPPLDLAQDPSLNNPRPDTGSAVFSDPWMYPNPVNFPDSLPSLFYMRFNQNPCEGGLSPNGQIQQYEQSEPYTPLGEDGQQSAPINYGQQVGDPQDDSRGNKVANVQAASHFTDIELQSRYMTNHGRVAMPFSYRSDNKKPTCVIRRVHQPLSKRVIYYRATRYNSKPTIPKLYDNFTDANGINYYLDESEILPYPPALTPDGTQYMFTIELRLEYLMDRNINPDEEYQPGSMPWDTGTLADTVLKLDDLEDEEIA